MTKLHPTYQRLMKSVIITELSLWIATFLAYYFFIRSSQKLTFLHPEFLWLWISIPLFIGANILQWNHKQKIYSEYSGYGSTRILWVTFSFTKAFLHYLLLRLALFFLVVSLAQPISGSRRVKGSKRVLDLVICLDISNSMNTEDMSGNKSRLYAAKQAISHLMNQMAGERIAVIVFANDAYTQLPLTLDYGAAKLFVPDIETSMITDQGTNIGRALEVAQEQFKDEESGRALLVITDGEDHEKLWQEQTAELKEKNVEICYLGLGTSTGGVVPIDPYDDKKELVRENGQPVISKLDKSSLKRMASESGADLVVSSSAFPDMTSVARTFSNAKNKSVKSIEFNVDKNYYQVPLVIAIILFVAYLFLPFLFTEKLENK